MEGIVPVVLLGQKTPDVVVRTFDNKLNETNRGIVTAVCGARYKNTSLQLDNTMGVIDSDYYYSDNEGHIFAKVTNDNHTGKSIIVEAATGFLQAIFIPYGITCSDDAKGVRNGGMGSTDSKA